MKLSNLLFLVIPAMAFQNYTMPDMPISVSPLLKALPKYGLPSEHMTWDQLTNAQEERNKEHGCRYEINDHIITLKPTSKMSTTEHAAWAQSVHDKSTKEGLDPTCKGVQTKLSIRDIEWYYHGCFALDALHEIALHQDTWSITAGIYHCERPFRVTKEEAAEYRARSNPRVQRYRLL